MGVITKIVAADEPIGRPKCGYVFALSEGIPRQAIERRAFVVIANSSWRNQRC